MTLFGSDMSEKSRLKNIKYWVYNNINSLNLGRIVHQQFDCRQTENDAEVIRSRHYAVKSEPNILSGNMGCLVFKEGMKN